MTSGRCLVCRGQALAASERLATTMNVRVIGKPFHSAHAFGSKSLRACQLPAKFPQRSAQGAAKHMLAAAASRSGIARKICFSFALAHRGSPLAVRSPTAILTTSSRHWSPRATRRLHATASSEVFEEQPVVHPALQAFKIGKLGFGFSAGGLVFPYFIGVMGQLEDLGIISHDTPLAGASAGSLIVACHRAGVSNDDLLESCLELAKDCRAGGTRFRLRSVLSKHLFDRLPEDAHKRCSGSTYVAVTRLWPTFAPVLVSEYTSRDDLIQAMLTSCHIPWYLDGKLIVRYRDGFYADGGLTQFIPRPPAEHVTKICCFPSQQMRAFSDIEISPDNFGDWPYSTREMLQWAFEPAADEILHALVDKGKGDAYAWAKSTGILAHLATVAKEQDAATKLQV